MKNELFFYADELSEKHANEMQILLRRVQVKYREKEKVINSQLCSFQGH